jgi:hypothetical protein
MLDCHNPNKDEGVRVFIGSDTRAFKRAEIALEYSIKKYASGPVKIEWMDFYRGDEKWQGWDRSAWYTPFTCYRFGIPEYSGFEGRSIYVDVDQIFLDDVYKLINLPIPDDKALLSLSWIRTDVMVLDNAKFKSFDWWPSIEDLKTSRTKAKTLCRLIGGSTDVGAYKPGTNIVGKLPPEWCCNDGHGYNKDKTCLLHYTEMKTQPWRPYPKGWKMWKFDYPDHPNQEATRLWWEMYAEALEDKFDCHYVVDEKLSNQPIDYQVKYK